MSLSLSYEILQDCVEYVHSSTGLYPSPMARNAKSSQRTKTRNKFVFIGKFIAKVSTVEIMSYFIKI